MSKAARRAARVAATVDRIRAVERAGRERDGEVTRATLARVKAPLIDLTAETELFPAEQFAPPGEGDSLYRLSEDPDHRFALYAVSARPAAGLALFGGLENLAATCDDVWHRPYDRADGVEAAMPAYLDRELDLVRQVQRDGSLRFQAAPP
jgi:hypothetical protein